MAFGVSGRASGGAGRAGLSGDLGINRAGGLVTDRRRVTLYSSTGLVWTEQPSTAHLLAAMPVGLMTSRSFCFLTGPKASSGRRRGP